jgi:hypothetical protein
MMQSLQESGMVALTCNPNTPEARVEDCEFEASLGYLVRPCLKKPKNPL